jgi:hypothetical protein
MPWLSSDVPTRLGVDGIASEWLAVVPTAAIVISTSGLT